jgi:hypothetical protein
MANNNGTWDSKNAPSRSIAGKRGRPLAIANVLYPLCICLFPPPLSTSAFVLDEINQKRTCTGRLGLYYPTRW